jgi:hippurate hydrolase
MPIKNRFAELHDEICAWRQDIHQNPELLFETHRTSALVAERLKEFGADEIVTGIGRTGVVGVIKGLSNTSGKVIGLRADMDALPIQEATGLEYASKTDGAMHACGHDGHTAMLLGAAKYLAETRQFDGTVVVIFQPAEEGGGGGREMCEDGMMDRFGVQEVYAMHNWPPFGSGEFAIRPGPFFAASDLIEITITGQGGHAAKPQETVDSTLVASHLILALQSIASRNVDPIEQVVVSVTSFETSSKAFNVIPEWVHLRGTVRTMTPEVRDLAEKRVLEISRLTAETYGAVADAQYKRSYPVMNNSPEQSQFAAEIAEKVAGKCDEASLVMGGEDFSFMLQERPGAYILLGNGDSAPVHTERYNFNDEIIPAGCSWFAELAEQRMPLAK